MLEKPAKDDGIRLAGDALTRAVSDSIDNLRERIANGEHPNREEIIQVVRADVGRLEYARLKPIINATGVIIHTNLGRTPVSDETAEAMARAASSYVALEIDPET